MKLNHFKVSIIILLIGTVITKIGSFIIKVLFTRVIGVQGLSYYTIIIPTVSLFITMSSLSIPLSLSKVIGENKYSTKQVIISTFIVLIIIQFVLMAIFILITPIISEYFLHDKKLSILIYAFILTLPFISTSSILKGYYLGKKMVIPNIISNILEQVIRIIFLVFILPRLVIINLWLGLVSYILLNIITEILSIIILNLFLPKNKNIRKDDLIVNKDIVKDVFSISLPVTSSHLIGSIGFFFEPIILTNMLLFNGYSLDYVMGEYAIYNSYVISLLILPSFFIGAMCQLFVPEISKHKKNQNYKQLKLRIREIIIYSFLLGLIYLVILFLFKENLLKILYHTDKGIIYINILIPFFILYYLEYPLHSILEALGYSKNVFLTSLYGTIIKSVALILLSLKKIGIYALIYAEIIYLLVIFFLLLWFLWKAHHSF